MSLNIAGLDTASGDLSRHVPNGPYMVSISKAEMTETKGGLDEQGQQKPKLPMLKFQFRIIGGDYEGRVIFDQIVLPSEKAKDSSNRMNANRLKKLGVSSGILAAGSTEFRYEDLPGRQLKLIVGIRYDRSTTPPTPQNTVEDYLPAE